MKKIVTILLSAAFLVSCGPTPKSVLKGYSSSLYRMAKVLTDGSSSHDQVDVLRDELKVMRDLYSDARAVRGEPHDLFVALAEVESSDDFVICETARKLSRRDYSKEVEELIGELQKEARKVQNELEKACNIREETSSSSRDYDDD